MKCIAFQVMLCFMVFWTVELWGGLTPPWSNIFLYEWFYKLELYLNSPQFKYLTCNFFWIAVNEDLAQVTKLLKRLVEATLRRMSFTRNSFMTSQLSLSFLRMHCTTIVWYRIHLRKVSSKQTHQFLLSFYTKIPIDLCKVIRFFMFRFVIGIAVMFNFKLLWYNNCFRIQLLKKFA